MRPWKLVVPFFAAAIGCSAPADLDLGTLTGGKADDVGLHQALSLQAGETRSFTFAASGAFTVRVSQSGDPAARPLVRLAVTDDGHDFPGELVAEPIVHVTPEEASSHAFHISVTDAGQQPLVGALDVSADAALPDPNAAMFPPDAWLPPPPDAWPSSYVIFNNTGCSHDCTRDDQSQLKNRSVMLKMIVAAIRSVRVGGTIRVSNFNISSSSAVASVVDALYAAMRDRQAHVRIVMDSAQNTPDSKTTELAKKGAEVRFVAGLTYQSSSDPGVDKLGIMHSKMVVVDDQVLLTGSNNFSSTGFITNEENSVVLRAPEHADRIGSFICDFEQMFQAGVEAGAAQKPDTDETRRAAILGLLACNGPDVWFPPTGALEENGSKAYSAVTSAIFSARHSIYLAPDMLAHPGLVSALVRRAERAKDAGQPFRVELVLDASPEAFGNPAFGACLEQSAAEKGLDVEVRYWPGTAEIYQLMHHKFMIIDGEDDAGATLFNGSANYSAKALKWSFENVTRYRATQVPEVVRAFTARFHQLFQQAKPAAQLSTEDHLTVPACPLASGSF